jgi:hypothetical protein
MITWGKIKLRAIFWLIRKVSQGRSTYKEMCLLEYTLLARILTTTLFLRNPTLEHLTTMIIINLISMMKQAAISLIVKISLKLNSQLSRIQRIRQRHKPKFCREKNSSMALVVQERELASHPSYVAWVLKAREIIVSMTQLFQKNRKLLLTAKEGSVVNV